MPRTARRKLKLTDLGRVSDTTLEKGRGRFAALPTSGIEWIPNRRVLRPLPTDYRLQFRIITGPDGLRQIVPTVALQDFVLTAAVGGLAIMTRVRRTSAEQRYTYRLMSLLHQWSHSNRRLLNRQFKRAEDLELRKSERTYKGEKSNLPHALVECSEPWTVSRFLKEGRSSARSAGHSSPSVDKQVAYALLEIAAESPSIANLLDPTQSEKVIRYSLLGSNQGARLPHGTDVSEIEERLIKAVHKKLSLSTDEFDR